jgi:hypothetical protein
MIAPEEFDALLELLDRDPSSPANVAARAVLVDGKRQADAMRATGISRAAVCNAVKRFRDADALILAAYGIKVRRQGDLVTKERLWTVVRLSGGAWKCVESPDELDLSGCETWEITADSAEKALAKAQQKRSRYRAKAGASGKLSSKTS